MRELCSRKPIENLISNYRIEREKYVDGRRTVSVVHTWTRKRDCIEKKFYTCRRKKYIHNTERKKKYFFSCNHTSRTSAINLFDLIFVSDKNIKNKVIPTSHNRKTNRIKPREKKQLHIFTSYFVLVFFLLLRNFHCWRTGTSIKTMDTGKNVNRMDKWNERANKKLLFFLFGVLYEQEEKNLSYWV